MKVFKELTLPLLGIAAETHPIRHIVQYSPELPESYRAQLEDLADMYPFLVLSDVTNVGNTHPLEVGAQLAGESGVYAQYRLDDDDFLSPQYFEDLSHYVAEPFLGFRVSMAAGLTGIFDGENYNTIRYSHRPNIAIGLASIQGENSSGQFIAPPNGGHHEADRLGPVIVDSRHCSYFWTRHGEQDTDFGKGTPLTEIKKQVELLPPVPENWDPASIFPLPHLNWASRSTRVASDTWIPMEGAQFDCDLSGAFSLEIDATYPDGMQSTSALISFQLEDSGKQYDWAAVDSGLVKSYYDDIGYFRYLFTYPGRRSSEYEIHLPAGARATAIKIRPFGSGAQPFEVHALKVKM